MFDMDITRGLTLVNPSREGFRDDDPVRISWDNGKYNDRGIKIPVIDLPAGITCPGDVPCFKRCYANGFLFKLDKKRDAMYHNFRRYLVDPDGFFDDIASCLRYAPALRWQGSGDIPSVDYLERMIWIAKKEPDKPELCFTKAYRIVNQFDPWMIPKNLNMLMSPWELWQPVNPYEYPTFWIYANSGIGWDLIPAAARMCGGNCARCLRANCGCWVAKRGEHIFTHEHGNGLNKDWWIGKTPR